MNHLKKILTFFLLIALGFSCSQKPAQVLNRSRAHYGQNNQANKEKYKNITKKEVLKTKELPPIKEVVSFKTASTATLAPVAAAPTADLTQNKNSKNTQIDIVAGDTLLSISKKHQVTLRDLIKQNQLTPPYSLKVGTKLLIPAPHYHEVKTGDTLYSISRLYNMKVNNLIEMNDLRGPYGVRLGEKLRIEKFAEENVASAVPVVSVAAVKMEVAKNEASEVKAPEPIIERVEDKFNQFSWPLKGEVVSKFGPKKGGLYNDGINIKAKEGEDVKASEDGVVAYVGNELKGYGNLIIVKHSNGWITAYAHLKNSLVTRGKKVKKGDKIATVGSTGNVSSSQLYFGLRKGRDAVNPQSYLK